MLVEKCSIFFVLFLRAILNTEVTKNYTLDLNVTVTIDGKFPAHLDTLRRTPSPLYSNHHHHGLFHLEQNGRRCREILINLVYQR